jgi:catechol 2,3-dioxygenase-like lactoylglutathione lyase family enzyme
MNAPPFTAHGSFFALSVPDVAASSRWYQEKLGLNVVMAPAKSGEVSAVILEGGGLLVELIQHDAAQPLGSAAPGARGPQYVHGYFKAGLMVDDFDRSVVALRTRGVDIAYGPYPKTATQRASVVIRDNAGNLIQFLGR